MAQNEVDEKELFDAEEDIPAEVEPEIDPDVADALVKMTYTRGVEVTNLIEQGVLPRVEELAAYVRKEGVDEAVRTALYEGVHILSVAAMQAAMDKLTTEGLSPIILNTVRTVLDVIKAGKK